MKKSIIISGQTGTGRTRTSMVIAHEKDYGYVVVENIADLEKYIDTPTVVEFDTLSAKEFDKLPYKDKFHVVFLGFATAQPKALFEFWQGSGYQSGRNLSDDMLMVFARETTATGKRNKKACDELGYKFIDIVDLKSHGTTSPYASQVWEYLFNEKKQVNLGTKTKFDV